MKKERLTQVKRPGNSFFEEEFELNFITNQEMDIKNKIWKSLMEAELVYGNTIDDCFIKKAEEDEQPYFVYFHYHKGNLKYVGITSQDNVKKRWGHGSGYKDNERFEEALNKVEWDDWTFHGIIVQGVSEETAKFLETLFIEVFNSYENGLNKNRGGFGRPVGVKFSKEERKKISEGNMGIKRPKKKILAVNTKTHEKKVYPNQEEAAKATKTQQPNISTYKNTGKELGGYYFYTLDKKEEYKNPNYTSPEMQKIRKIVEEFKKGVVA